MVRVMFEILQTSLQLTRMYNLQQPIKIASNPLYNRNFQKQQQKEAKMPFSQRTIQDNIQLRTIQKHISIPQ